MPFQFADLLVTVIHRHEIDDTRPPPPIPWFPDRPTDFDDLRAVFEHGLAMLDVGVGAALEPPRTLTEVVALEQQLSAALREVRELRRYMAERAGVDVPDQGESYDGGSESAR